MKRNNIALLYVVLFMFSTCMISLSAPSDTSSRLAAGLRKHVANPALTVAPYGKDDISFLLAYEYQEGPGYWQVAVDYASDVSGSDTDYILTPQLNLIAADSFWRLGVGVLSSYIKDKTSGSDWSDVYWQLLGGINFPIGPIEIEILGMYSFDKWSAIQDFDFDAMDYGALIKYAF